MDGEWDTIVENLNLSSVDTDFEMQQAIDSGLGVLRITNISENHNMTRIMCFAESVNVTRSSSLLIQGRLAMKL